MIVNVMGAILYFIVNDSVFFEIYIIAWQECFCSDEDIFVVGVDSDTDDATSSEVLQCPACDQPDTYENIIENFCQSDFGE
jgi:hypothetical protein